MPETRERFVTHEALSDRIVVQGKFLCITRFVQSRDPRSEGWQQTAMSFRLPVAAWDQYRATIDLLVEEAQP